MTNPRHKKAGAQSRLSVQRITYNSVRQIMHIQSVPSNQKINRVAIGKKQRFEVFKRDSFTCQYCGSKAPDVVLHVDHINPVSKGGENEIINLITSCVSCNLGKSDRLLTDKTSIEMQRKQLEELAERRDQLEMMLAWRDSLKGLDDDIVDEVAIRIEGYIPGNSINDHGKSMIRKWLKKYSIEEDRKSVV